MEIKFLEYLEKIKSGNYKPAIKICWLYPDETVQSSFTNELYEIKGSINITYQTGVRRTCNLTVKNNKGQFPIDYDHIWFGQKFQIWAGVYLNDGSPYYISQGIFCVLNPKDVYNPDTKTMTIQGKDKWCYLDGTLFGNLTGIYSQSFGTKINEAATQLLKANRYDSYMRITDDVNKQIDVKPCIFDTNFYSQTRKIIQYYMETGDIIYQNSEGQLYIFQYSKKNNAYKGKLIIEENEEYKLDSLTEVSFDSEDTYYTKTENVFNSPYTIKIENNKTLADYYKEVGTILTANVYYDNFGYMRIVPMSTITEDKNDEDKEIAWNFYDGDKNLLSLEIEHDFTSVYNDIVVLGKIVNGKQMSARLQNHDPSSPFNIDVIGLKTKPPYSDENYYSDSLCFDLAKYYARTEMDMQKKINVKCAAMYHLDVNTLFTITMPEKNMVYEKFLISSLSIPLSGGTMSITGTNLRDFTTWTEVSTYEEKEETENGADTTE